MLYSAPHFSWFKGAWFRVACPRCDSKKLQKTFRQIDVYGIDKEQERIILLECKLKKGAETQRKAKQQLEEYKAVLQHRYPRAHIRASAVYKYK